MDRAGLSPKELTNKQVYDCDGELLGTIREVTYEPGHGVETIDVEVDPETPGVARVGPYVELVPDEVERVGAGEVGLATRIEEIVSRSRPTETELTEEEATIGVTLLDEPAEDEAWEGDDWTPDWADEA